LISAKKEKSHHLNSSQLLVTCQAFVSYISIYTFGADFHHFDVLRLISLMAEEFLLLVVAAGKKRHLTFLLSRA
jgi:regulator of sigma D